MNKAFTLIELVIVVAIIGIFAAVAIPKIAQYRQRQHQFKDYKGRVPFCIEVNGKRFVGYNAYFQDGLFYWETDDGMHGQATNAVLVEGPCR